MNKPPESYGLFGPGIFGTGIDVSALDPDMAWRLGTFIGEQIAAAEARGYAKAVAEVLALHGPRPGWERTWKDPAEALANGWPMFAGCDMPGIAQRDLAHCPTRALFAEATKENTDHA